MKIKDRNMRRFKCANCGYIFDDFYGTHCPRCGSNAIRLLQGATMTARKQRLREILKALVFHSKIDNLEEKKKELEQKFKCTFDIMTIDNALTAISELMSIDIKKLPMVTDYRNGHKTVDYINGYNRALQDVRDAFGLD